MWKRWDVLQTNLGKWRFEIRHSWNSAETTHSIELNLEHSKTQCTMWPGVTTLRCWKFVPQSSIHSRLCKITNGTLSSHSNALLKSRAAWALAEHVRYLKPNRSKLHGMGWKACDNVILNGFLCVKVCQVMESGEKRSGSELLGATPRTFPKLDKRQILALGLRWNAVHPSLQISQEKGRLRQNWCKTWFLHILAPFGTKKRWWNLMNLMASGCWGFPQILTTFAQFSQCRPSFAVRNFLPSQSRPWNKRLSARVIPKRSPEFASLPWSVDIDIHGHTLTYDIIRHTLTVKRCQERPHKSREKPRPRASRDIWWTCRCLCRID